MKQTRQLFIALLVIFLVVLQAPPAISQKHIIKFGVTAGWWRFSPVFNYELFRKRTSLDIQFEAGMPAWRYVRVKPRNVTLESDGLYHTKDSWYYRNLLGGTYEKGEFPARDTKYPGAALNITAKIYLWLNGKEKGWPEGAWFKMGLATAIYSIKDDELVKNEYGKWVRTPMPNYFNKKTWEFTFGPTLQVGYSFANRRKNFTFEVGVGSPFYIPLSMFYTGFHSGNQEFDILDPMVGSKPYATIVVGGDLYELGKWKKKR